MTKREPAVHISIDDRAGLVNVARGDSLETVVWNHLMSRTGGMVAWSNPLMTQAGAVLASDARGYGWDPGDLEERIAKDCAVVLRDSDGGVDDTITFDLTTTDGSFQLGPGRQRHSTISHVQVNPHVFVLLDASQAMQGVPDAANSAETSRFDLALSGKVTIGPGRQVRFEQPEGRPSTKLAIEYVDESGRCVGAFSGLPFGGTDFVAGWQESRGVVRPSIQPLSDLLHSIRPGIPRAIARDL